MKIIIIGTGNVATSLHAAFAKKGIDAPMVYSRELTNIPEVDVYIYAVTDAALSEVVSTVHAPTRALHVHTSGTIPVSVFGADKPHCGIMYPFQTFSKAQPLDDWSEVPLI